MLSDEERKAVEAWMKRNKPKKYPTGHSAIYDEFGRKRSSLKFRLASLSKRIRAVKGHKTLTIEQLADKLDVPEDEVFAACDKHDIEVKW
jgi:antitoxin component HigA of HigAB toxin-antitoxin module